MITNEVTCWRKKKGVSKAHLARRIGMSRSYVTRLEQGNLQPSGEVMFRIARYLQCEIGDVFQWIGESGAAPSQPFYKQPITLPACPVGTKSVTDKSLVSPTAKAVAPSVAW